MWGTAYALPFYLTRTCGNRRDKSPLSWPWLVWNCALGDQVVKLITISCREMVLMNFWNEIGDGFNEFVDILEMKIFFYYFFKWNHEILKIAKLIKMYTFFFLWTILMILQQHFVKLQSKSICFTKFNFYIIFMYQNFVSKFWNFCDEWQLVCHLLVDQTCVTHSRTSPPRRYHFPDIDSWKNRVQTRHIDPQTSKRRRDPKFWSHFPDTNPQGVKLIWVLKGSVQLNVSGERVGVYEAPCLLCDVADILSTHGSMKVDPFADGEKVRSDYIFCWYLINMFCDVKFNFTQFKFAIQIWYQMSWNFLVTIWFRRFVDQ